MLSLETSSATRLLGFFFDTNFFLLNFALMTERENKYYKYFEKATAASSRMRTYRKRCEEFYFSDVDSTLSQFTTAQREKIRAEYDIPISTKIAYPLIEQMVAMLTGTMPYPKLVANNDDDQVVVDSYLGATEGVWHESQGQTQLQHAIRDAFIGGSGFLVCREAFEMHDSAFNVKLDHVSWKNVFIDPECTKQDLSDAKYVAIANIMTREKVEEEYDLNVKDAATDFNGLKMADIYKEMHNSGFGVSQTKDGYVWVIEFYVQEILNVYTAEGYLSTKKPKKIQVPNPELQQRMQDFQSKLVETQDQNTQADNTLQQQQQTNPTDLVQGAVEEHLADFQQQAQVMSDEMDSMDATPPTIEVYQLILDNGETKEVASFERIKKKRIRRVITVGNEIYEDKILPSSRLPIAHFCFNWGGTPNLTYGHVHFMMDQIKAMNKMYALAIKDMQTNGARKVIYAKGTIEDPNKAETNWSRPNSWTEYNANPALPNAGEPKVIDPSPLSQTITFLIDKLFSLVEYTVGINSLTQGNTENAPSTFGVAQQMATFGTQRIKLYGRSLETPLERLYEALISFLYTYMDKDKAIKYFDKDGKLQMAQVLDHEIEDLAFQVRIEVGSELPTTKQMFAYLLSIVATQSSNPDLKDFLTSVMLKNIDMPQAKQVAEDMDTVKKMSAKLQGVEAQLKESQSQEKVLAHNLEQAQIAARVREKVGQITNQLSAKKGEAIANLNQMEEQAQQPVPEEAFTAGAVPEQESQQEDNQPQEEDEFA